MSGPRRVVVAISGATGVVYGIRALELLREVDDVETHLVMTGPGRQTLAYETDLAPADVEALADVVHGSRDIAAPISSGSLRHGRDDHRSRARSRCSPRWPTPSAPTSCRGLRT